MRKYIFLTSVLALAACGGGNGGGVSTPRAPVAIDMTTTSLKDSENNISNIIAYANDALGKTPSTTSESNANTQSRNSSYGNFLQSDDGQYEYALAHYKNMYDFASGVTNNKTDDDLRNAYLISGGKAKDFDNWDNLTETDKTQIMDFIAANWERVLKHFFQWDNNNNKPTWKYKANSLSDMELNTWGSRDWGSDRVIISQTGNGKIKSFILKDGWFERDFNFERKSNNKFVAKEYSYAMAFLTQQQDQNGNLVDTEQTISFKADKPNMSIEQIKQGLLDSIEEYGFSDTDKQIAIERINNLTMKDQQAISQTEFEMTKDFTDEQTNEKFFVIPNSFEVDVIAYGQNVGLKFSDFGKIEGKNTFNNTGIPPQELSYTFVGGYDIKSIDKQTMADKNMKFSGTAVGRVSLFQEDNRGVASSDIMNIMSDASLVFNQGKEELVANFSENKNPDSRWYDIKVLSDGENVDFYLSNGDRITAQNQHFKFTDVDKETTFENINIPIWANPTEETPGHLMEGGLSTTYYGDGNTPTEVVGNAYLLQQDWSDDKDTGFNKELHFIAGFGATLDEK